MKTTFALALAVALVLTGNFAASQPDKGSGEPLVEQVQTSIAKGIRYLKDQEKGRGHWEDIVSGVAHPGGQTALTLLALLNAGVRPDDKMVEKALDYLRKVNNPSTYVRALQTMAFVEAGQSSDLQRIQENVKHLRDRAIMENGKLIGWGYDLGGPNTRPDNSNTQFALLAIWTASQIRKEDGTRLFEIDKNFWEQVRDYYTRTQSADGGWPYALDGDRGKGLSGDTITMTSAGLCGLFMAQLELTSGREDFDPVKICGDYPDHPAIKKGLSWISSTQGRVDRFTIDYKDHVFYNIYGIERLGRLSGQRFLGRHDWYREGCDFLVKKQDKQDGSWSLPGTFDNNRTISTSFALLFLSKGRTPVLISKLAHGPEPRQDNDQDWNRRRNDLRHLVEFASVNVFKKTPMTWQTFDMHRQNINNDDLRREVTAELLQSPILYITGHESPAKRLTDVEKKLLKQYADNGGFILGVACCGSKEFNDGFQELCATLWEDNALTTLSPDHPAWNIRFEVKPGSFGLKGIELGCKTVAILSTQNLCGFWEINRRTGEGETAFRLGANIIAYATGLEAPKTRLTPMTVNIAKKDGILLNPKRGFFQVGQIVEAGKEADWKPAPEAMSKLMQNLREIAGLDVVLKTANVTIHDKDLTKFKFLYMHGRNDFKFDGKDLERLRFNLKNGGLLLADACCGKAGFDKGFRQFIVDLFPKDSFPDGVAPMLVPIPPDDLLYSKDVNIKEALTEANIKCRKVRGKEFNSMPPALEGVKIGNRWVVIYSKYDIGCALEKHQSGECLGYNYDSALLLAKAAVLYHFRP